MVPDDGVDRNGLAVSADLSSGVAAAECRSNAPYGTPWVSSAVSAGSGVMRCERQTRSVLRGERRCRPHRSHRRRLATRRPVEGAAEDQGCPRRPARRSRRPGPHRGRGHLVPECSRAPPLAYHQAGPQLPVPVRRGSDRLEPVAAIAESGLPTGPEFAMWAGSNGL